MTSNPPIAAEGRPCVWVVDVSRDQFSIDRDSKFHAPQVTFPTVSPGQVNVGPPAAQAH